MRFCFVYIFKNFPVFLVTLIGWSKCKQSVFRKINAFDWSKKSTVNSQFKKFSINFSKSEFLKDPKNGILEEAEESNFVNLKV